ncbi:MAG TPA: fatty acid desaturase [Hanamia sp.]|nr:fatty acid desaturase [Hanamia sp.]
MKETITIASKPVFPKDNSSEIFLKLREKAFRLVDDLESKRKNTIIIKSILFPLLYIGAYISAIVWARIPFVFYGCYFIMGLMVMVIFINLIHDAVHHVLFHNKNLNNLFVYFFDLMGANSYAWKIRHTRLHHNYPNVMGWDSDIDQSPLARVFPHGPFSRLHKYQHIYLPVLYFFYLLNWLLVRDFKDYFNRKRAIWKVVDIPKREFVKLFFFKTFFIFYMIAVPIIIGVGWLQAVAAFLLMVFTATFFSLLILLSPHANVDHDFPLPNERNILPQSWFMHQINHTNDVIHDNWFIRFFMGSFNYHVAHHLFPSIGHMYYPEVTQALKEVANEEGLPYKSFTLLHTLMSHYRLLKSNRKVENIFEETM